MPLILGLKLGSSELVPWSQLPEGWWCPAEPRVGQKPGAMCGWEAFFPKGLALPKRQ